MIPGPAADEHTTPPREQMKRREPFNFEETYNLEDETVAPHTFKTEEELEQKSKIFTTSLPLFGQVSKVRFTIIMIIL